MKTLYAARFARVTENLARQGLTQMIVSDPPTIFYLTGVRIQPGERMLALLLRADGNHRFFVNALFGTPEAGIPVENYSDGEDAPAKLLPGWNGTSLWALIRIGPPVPAPADGAGRGTRLPQCFRRLRRCPRGERRCRAGGHAGFLQGQR